MPELSRFYGIVIAMFAKDHLPPHFHAIYGEYRAVYRIESTEMTEGDMPRRAHRLIQDWAELHKAELFENWFEALKDNPKFKNIEPLK